ncbi:SDR family oxidoreductase [Sphingosinicella sp. BN140058]|uniref:SDR family oxidoreductase n=1 Tax=Sphingosinicella sp. BN140058 TaxID=1892855 RepID=UPI001010D52E|nr:NAD(P)H-binding protein [Sphingosinicella sp. BN140058]QAY78964.1 NmrA family transcriptional regulator [Sphingosinicella sp. BN140058]
MKVTVIGGTGLVGRRVVGQLRRQGHEVVVAARSTGIDIVTGTGLAKALEGTDVVVDVSNSGYGAPVAMEQFFAAAGRLLLEAERKAGVAHHITMSAVGVGRLRSGYFLAKEAQEALVMEAGIAFTIVRSAPFFEFIYNIVDSGGDGDDVRLPPVEMQPIGADDAASSLARIAALGEASGILEVVGPERHMLPDLALEILTANEDQRRVLVDPDALYFGSTCRNEPLTAHGRPPAGSTSFDDWLRAWIASA